MTEREKTIVDILREKWELPESVTDEEIKEKSKSSFAWASVDLAIAKAELKNVVKEEMPNWVKRILGS